MEEKILNINQPPIIGYLQHAYNISIVQQHPNYEQWFNSNFIQIRYTPKANWLDFFTLDQNYRCYPLLQMRSMVNEITHFNKIDIIDFAVNCLKNDYYIWIFVDEFYIPNKLANLENRHFVHECLLYGYNIEKGVFYTAGFNAKTQYDFIEVKFEDFLAGYNAVEEICEIKLAKPRLPTSYEFDITIVKELIEDYLYSKNTSERNKMFGSPTKELVYGLDIYKAIKNTFENPINQWTHLDLRPLHILWEHKKCMSGRIEYIHKTQHLENLEPIYSKYKAVENKALILRTLQQKYRLTSNVDFIQKIINSFDELYNMEGEILTELVKNIH